MRFYDIFNGDADGLCALRQLRLVAPAEAELVTGTKRDIRLLDRVGAGPGDRLLVLDISMAPNATSLARVLAAGATVQWFDHHNPGNVPVHPGLEAHLDAGPAVCTSLLVDRHLGGKARAWAVTGAFGDNLHGPAMALAQAAGWSEARIDRLRRLGLALNYNAYGDRVEELLCDPCALYARLCAHVDPEVFTREDPLFSRIECAMAEDLEQALTLTPDAATARATVYRLPDAAWSRRVCGTFANHLARLHPDQAHAVLTPVRGHLSVSIRAPLTHPEGADRLALRFGGGGRAGAAGIEGFGIEALGLFVKAFQAHFG
jgi:hypothetical protein